MQAVPPPQGLYDGTHEHDACGVAFVATMTGVPSHEIVHQALTALRNLDHRGAAGADHLHGGLGNDTLEGGLGNDGFYFENALIASNVDDVLDFTAVNDTFFLDDAVFTALAAGTLAAAG